MTKDVADLKEFKKELEKLIRMYGDKEERYDLPSYNKKMASSLKSFSKVADNFSEGISSEKIRKVFYENQVPSEDFLYTLASIAEVLNGEEHYKELNVENPVRYEFEKYLNMCGYLFNPGSVFPLNEKFCKNSDFSHVETLSSIPNIFWDLFIDYYDVIDSVGSQIYGENVINLDNGSKITFGMYNFLENENFNVMKSATADELFGLTPDIISFRIDNQDEKLIVKTMQAERYKNMSRIMIELFDGKWVELLNTMSIFGDCEWQDLEAGSHYNYDNLCYASSYFRLFDDEHISIDDLQNSLSKEPKYNDLHKQLSIGSMKKFENHRSL